MTIRDRLIAAVLLMVVVWNVICLITAAWFFRGIAWLCIVGADMLERSHHQPKKGRP